MRSGSKILRREAELLNHEPPEHVSGREVDADPCKMTFLNSFRYEVKLKMELELCLCKPRFVICTGFVKMHRYKEGLSNSDEIASIKQLTS